MPRSQHKHEQLRQCIAFKSEQPSCDQPWEKSLAKAQDRGLQTAIVDLPKDIKKDLNTFLNEDYENKTDKGNNENNSRH